MQESAISYRGEQPKIGLTMRQPGLGKLEWVETRKEKAKKLSIKKKKNQKRKNKMAKEKACLNCKAIYQGDKCPICGETPSNESFKGRVYVLILKNQKLQIN